MENMVDPTGVDLRAAPRLDGKRQNFSAPYFRRSQYP